jgi:alkylation response protein AidB-like acyl-CoA dehydrogenase
MCDDLNVRRTQEAKMGTTLLDQVDGLADVIGSNIASMEQERRLADEVVAGIRATGLNRALVPVSLGGDDRHLIETLESIERIASFDGSTGWCAAISSGSNVFSGYIAPEVGATVWADPDQGNAGMFGPFGQVRANGQGLTLSGRWPFCSNSLHSSWIGVGTFWYGDSDEPEPIPRYVFVPMDDVTVESTWDAPGLCATGSHHASIDGAAVARERSMTFVDPSWAEGPLWRLPLFCILAPCLGVTPLGMARGALDEVSTRIEGNVAGTRGALADDPVGLADFAEADAALRAARAGLVDAVSRAWDHAERGEKVPKVVQAHVMMSMNYGCQVAVDVTSTAHRLGGGSAAYADSSLLRRLRDVQTARQHIMFGRGGRPMMAKTLAGEDTFMPPFIV